MISTVVMHVKAFSILVIAIIAISSLCASKHTERQIIIKRSDLQSNKPVSLDDIGEKNKSQKVADGPGSKKESKPNPFPHNQSIKRKKELGESSFNTRAHQIRTPLPSLHKFIHSFRSCSSSGSVAVHNPKQRTTGKGKEPSTSSSSST